MRRSTDASRSLPDLDRHDEDIVAVRESGASGLSARQLLHVLFKYKWLILAFFVGSVTIASIVQTFLVTPTYVATSQVLVSPGREHVADFSLPTGGAVPPWVRYNTDEETARTIELLTGRSLAERVVRAIGVDVLYPAEEPSRWRVWTRRTQPESSGSREEAALDRFGSDLSAEAASRSSIIIVSFTHPDPDIAARVVNLLTDLYVERYLGMHQNPKADAFFEEQFKTLERKLRKAEDALLAFRQRHGITSAVSDEQAQVRQAQAGLRVELNEARSRQAELQSRAGELRQQMAEHGTLYGNLQTELLRNAAEEKAARARAQAIAAKIGELQARLDGLERVRDDYGYLEKQVKADEDSYRLYLSKFEEVRIAGAMDRERIVSVRVVEPARVPNEPVKSRLERLAILSVPFGLFGGIAVALLLHFTRRTLDTAEDVETALDLPVLASIPD